MAEVVEGGPEPEPQKETPKESTKEIKVGNETFVVNEAMAKAFETQMNETNQRIESLTQAFNQMQEKVNKPPQPDPETAQTIAKYNWETKLFEDPNNAVSEIIAQAKEEAKKELTDMYRQEETRKKSSEAFWKDFYEKNPDLKGAEVIVEAMAVRESDLHSLPADEGKKQLAERTREYILNLKPSQGGKPPIVEGAPSKAPTTETPEPEKEEQASLGSILRDKQKRRAEARRNNLKAVN